MKEKKPSKRETGPWVLPPPWLPAPYELGDLSAVQAVAEGVADAGQQKRALKWIIEQVCGTYDLGWHPSGGHEASFAAGRRFAGTQIVKALHINVASLVRNDNG